MGNRMGQHGLDTAPWIDHVASAFEILVVKTVRHIDQGGYRNGVVVAGGLLQQSEQCLQIATRTDGAAGGG